MKDFQERKIRRLVRIGDEYWAATRLSWNLGLFSPSMYSLNLAIELYLRAAWLTEQDFVSEKAMEEGIRKFQRSEEGKPHDIQSMINRQPKRIQELFSKRKLGFTLVDDGVIRFAESDIAGYGDKLLREAERFIRTLREAIGFANPRSSYEQIFSTSHLVFPKDKDLASTAIKKILMIKNRPSKKKIRKELRKSIDRAFKNWKNDNQ